MSVWAKMSQIDVRSIKEKKNGFDYLSWAHAYRILKENVPHATVIKHTFDNGNGVYVPYMKDDAGYAYVQVSVDLGDGNITTEIYPVTDFKNAGIVNPKSPDVNNALQRCMAKTIAMATGIGLNLFYGEDIPRTVEAVGVDSSAQQAASGSDPAGSEPKLSMSGSISNLNNNVNTREASNKPVGSQTPMKKPEITLHQLIELAPNRESLTKLYNERKGSLTDIDLEIFKARAKELENNG